MNPQYRRALLFAVLGVLLLGNHVYAYPDGVSSEERITYEATEADGVPDAEYVRTTVDVRRCSWTPIRSRTCAFERSLDDGGALRVPVGDEPTRETYAAHDFVRTPEGYFRPNTTLEDGALVLRLDPVSESTVRDALATEFDRAPEYVQTAIREGTVTVNEDDVYEESRFYVVRDGTYYLVEPTANEYVVTGWGWRDPPHIAVEAIRLGGWIAGVALLVRAGEWSERGRREAE
ncbi:hypothetical protein [Halogeometricum limi]|uniref:Uncharacterized protein n=1 Tax=Halogeometricum limi TaxID=555875 RepID=A0A1I6FUA0_9EURY|nr:hypothetical protein [Halogeometricum limi]SFR33387.1 hypothetical protein SAMN04488124_0293 [Halogeometricum limi]